MNKEHLSIPFCFIKFICIDKLMQYIQEELSLLLSWYLTLPNLSAHSVYAAPVCGLDEETKRRGPISLPMIFDDVVLYLSIEITETK